MRRNHFSFSVPQSNIRCVREPDPTDVQAYFGALFDRASVGIARLDADGNAVVANPAIERLLGRGADELALTRLPDLMHPRDRERARRLHRELMAGARDAYEDEQRFLRPDGEVVWVRLSAWCDGTAQRPPLATAMLEDITPAKVAERALEERSARLQRVIATQRDIMAAAGDLQQVMDVIVHRSQALTRAQGAMVSLLDGDHLVTRAASGIAARHLLHRRPLAQSVARFAVESGEPLLIERAENDPRLNPELRVAVGDRSHICVPLFAGDRAVGALSVMSASEDERLSEEDRQTLELLAGALSAGVSRAAEAEAERRQIEALARFEAIYRGALIAAVVVSPVGDILDANPATEELLGRPKQELIGKHLNDFVHAEDRDRIRSQVRQLVARAESCLRTDHRFVRADGDVRWVAVSLSLVRDEAGALSFGIVTAQDVTERRAAEEALRRQAQLNEHQALHDALTGLPNRSLFRRRVEQLVKTTGPRGEHFAVAMMDLDRFKEVNDSLGHHAGDALLMEIAQRLRGALRASDTVARLGGDEFGLLLTNVGGPDDALTVLRKLQRAFEKPVTVDELALSVQASIGVALYPQDGDDVETLLRTSDIAMYCAKETSTRYAFYDPAQREPDPSRLTLVADLRRAVAAGELVLHYQPKASLRDGSVEAVEALLRWRHPERGLLGPDQFIALAERSGMINPLTLHVIDEALGQLRRWERQGLTLSVSVNVSVRSLLDVDFPVQVRRSLDRWEVPPSRLELEITESTMLADPIRVQEVLEQLAELGVVLSIDDFGTGCSSLAHLTQLPVDEIKIDRSFVMNMLDSEHNAAIVRSTIDLGRSLGLVVVAEGVENEQVWRRLRALGCTLAQGYYLTRPIPPDQLSAWVRDRRGRSPLVRAA